MLVKLHYRSKATKRSLAIGFIVTSILVAAAASQDAPTASKQAKYLWTKQVTIAEGKAASHPGLIAQARRAAEVTKAEIYWITAGNLTGDLRRMTFLSFYDDFAAIERDMWVIHSIGAEAMQRNPDFAVESGQHELAPTSTIAVFRGDLSYKPEKVPASEAKYWTVTTIFLKAGHMTDFAEQRKEEIELLKRGGLDHQMLIYQVMAGLPSSGSVFYVMVPLRTLADVDIDDSAKASAVFTPAVRRRFEATNQQMISHVESDFLVVRPDLSRPPASYVAANPDFWTVKEPPSTAASRKTVEKAAAKEKKR